ncbi:hypothetical protein [Actinacidiphila yeochonensis]|uniref:hypothetical protein n=1 Tax=Actinacidiphila yeochonensis TaxID=89050 RepID=UPI00055C03A9|nr:hypothetical protein [Actinacidiphila yeochonensis]
MTRTTFTAGAVLILLAVLSGPAVADGGNGGGGGAAPAARAPALWQPRGPELAGADNTTDAPQMKPDVTFRDTIAPGQTRMYGLALDSVSTAYASVFAVPPTGAAVSLADGIELKLTAPDGTECDGYDDHFGDDGDAHPLGGAVVRSTGPDDDCASADQYTLQVHRTSDGKGDDQRPWALELRTVLEPALKPGTAPVAPQPTVSASPTPLTAGTSRPAHGGVSPETAAAVKTGVWKDRVLPGETRFYEIPVDWGQSATIFADFSNAPAAGTGVFVGSGVRLAVYNPLRQFVHDREDIYDGNPAALSEQLAPVAYGNRDSDDDSVAPVRCAGWYYVALTVNPRLAKVLPDGLPVTLRVQVSGTVQPAPVYASDPSGAGIGVGGHDLAQADGTATGGSGSSGRPALRLVAYGAFGLGALLLLALAGWYGTAWRRTGAAARHGG